MDEQQKNLADSSPELVTESAAAFNGQKCKKYEGKCVDLNNNAAMNAACGKGMTVVSWDDAGCGRANHVSLYERFHVVAA